MEIFAFIKSLGGKVTTGQIAREFKLTINGALIILRSLIEIRRIGKTKGPNAEWVISSV